MQLFLSHALQVPGGTNLAPDELLRRMEERFSSAVASGHSVCALACEPLGLDGIECESPGLTPRVLGALALALEPAFQASEAIVQRDERCLLVLLVGLDPTRVEAACQAWIAGASELHVVGASGPLRTSPRIGYAVTQVGKRLFLDTLIQVAHEGLRIARCRAPGACVHTLLYDFFQSQLERERGTEGLTVTASAPVLPNAPARERETDAEPPETTAATPRAREPSSQHGAPENQPRGPRESVPSSGATPVRESALTDPERRERELTEALDAQRRENEALLARLRDLETWDVPPGGASRGEPDSLDSPAQSAQDRIDVLERRLAKLKLALTEAEEHLAQASRANGFDSGITSIYRTVQGLEADAPHFALKTAMMAKMFAANLELRERLRRRQA